MQIFNIAIQRLKIFILPLLLSAATPACSNNGAQRDQDSTSTTSEASFSGAKTADLNSVSSKDDSIFRAKIAAAKAQKLESLPIGERIVAAGKLFLGVPYVGGTLDIDSNQERLIINLQGLDCVTFYENALAFARILKKYPNPTLKNYQDELTFLRYRDGAMNGFHSRLHYSIDYFRNNEKKGVLKIVTLEVGGTSAVKETETIDFMSTHRSAYKQLAKDDSEFAAIKRMEQEVSKDGGYYYVPKEKIESIESKIQPGDILGITTAINGLDCSHTGIAVRGEDGRIHFMHASSLLKQVVISEEPLAEYLTHSSKQTGIVVNRPIEVQTK